MKATPKKLSLKKTTSKGTDRGDMKSQIKSAIGKGPAMKVRKGMC